MLVVHLILPIQLVSAFPILDAELISWSILRNLVQPLKSGSTYFYSA